MNLLVLYGSSRRGGNSDLLVQRVIDGVEHHAIVLSEMHITPIEDKRHTATGFEPLSDDYDHIISQVLTHDIIVIGCPIYWYGMPGHVKLFFDRWSQSLRDKRFQFKSEMANKEAFVILTGGDQPRIKGLPLIQQFSYIFGYVGTKFAGYVIGEGDKPGAILDDARALSEATLLNARLRQAISAG